MANKLKAINKHRPKIKLGKTVGMIQIISFIAGRTGLNVGELQIVLAELCEAVKFFNNQGQGVKIERLGTYTPKIDTKGKLSVSHRLSKEISNALNSPGAFQGEIQNRANIGKSVQELIDIWNEENPNDKVTE